MSGRAIANLDALSSASCSPIAGLHGFERRTSDGTYLRKPLPAGELLHDARRQLQRLTTEVPDLLLEDKRFSLALHYRKVPHLEVPLLAEVSGIVATLGPDFELQRGRCVAEIHPASANKAATDRRVHGGGAPSQDAGRCVWAMTSPMNARSTG